MKPFKEFFIEGSDNLQIGVNHRHRGHGFTDTQSSYRRKHLNLVPDYAKTDMSKNPKIENLKNNNGTCVCTTNDLQYIRNTFNIIPCKDKEHQLGKTGIKLFYNSQNNSFMLQK